MMFEKYINLRVILYAHLYNLGSVYLRWWRDGKSQWQCTYSVKHYLTDMVESLYTGAHRDMYKFRTVKSLAWMDERIMKSRPS